MNRYLSQPKKNQYAGIASMFFIVFLLLGMRAYSQTATCAGAPNIAINAGVCAASGPYAIAWNTIAGAISAPAPLAPCPTTGLVSNAWGTFTATGTTTTISYYNTNRDAVLWIYSGTCPGTLTQIACADNITGAGANTESVTISTVIGQVYFVRVARKAAAGNIATGTICISNTPVPANDEPCTPTALGAVPLSCSYTSSTTSGATPSITPVPPPPGCANYIGNDVWFSAVVPASGAIIIDTRGGLTAGNNLVDGGMALYTGACGALALVACDDNSSVNPNNMPSISAAGLAPGTTVYIRFWANNINSFGAFDICVYNGAPCNTWDNPCTTPVTLTVNVSCVYTPLYNNTCATPTAGVANPSCAPLTYSGGDVWFLVTVPASGNLTLQGNRGAGTLVDGAMALYSAPSCSGPFTELYCDDNSAGAGYPHINASGLAPGTTVYVRFWGASGAVGSFRLCAFTACSTPANDNCSGAIALTLGAGCPTTRTNICASPSAGEPAPGCGNYNGGDVWFSVIVPASGTVIANGVAGTLTDGALAIYSGACGGLTLLGCDDDSGPGVSPALTLSGLAPGSTVYIRYWEYGGGTGGTFGLCVSDPCPGGTPANDLPCSASFLPYGIFIPGTNGCATNTSDPASLPGCFTNGGAAQWNTVWYRFMATSACTKIKTSTGTLNNTQIAVYSGAGGCGSLGAPLACNDDHQPCGAGSFTYNYSQLQVNTSAGTMYYIMLDGLNGQTGTFSIQIIDGGAGCVNNFAPAAGQDCALPIPVCSYTVSVPDPGFQAVGNVCDFPPPSPCTGGTAGCNNCATSCLCSGERGSGWYAITISGVAPSFLEFTILPNDYNGTPFSETDYDFALFGPMPAVNPCSNLTSPVRCHYSALGVTGIYGAANGQAPAPYAPNYNGAFRQRLSVNPGEVYYLNVSNFSVSNAGFTLSFQATSFIASTVPAGGTVIWTGAVSTDWHNANNWGGCQIPDCATNVNIPNFPVNQPVISTADASCRTINVSLGSSLTLSNPRQLMVCNDYTNDGTFTAGNTTTVLFQDTCLGCPGGINHNQVMNGNMTVTNKFNHVTVNKTSGFKVTTNQDVDMAGNFLISGAAGTGNFDATGKYHKVAGDFTVSTAPSLTTYTPATVLEFNGPFAPPNQNYYNRGLLDSVVMNQTAGIRTVTLLDHGLAGTAWMRIGGAANAGTLTLTNGKIIAGFTHGVVVGNRVEVINRLATAVSVGNTTSYVEGALRRYMPPSGTGSYNFPVGNAAKGYERINFNITAALPAGMNYWDVYFDAVVPASPTFVSECSSQYHNTITALNHGLWNVLSSPAIISGTASPTLNNKVGDWTNTTGAGWTVQYNNSAVNGVANWLLTPFPQAPCIAPPNTAVLRANMNLATVFGSGNEAWFASAQSLTPLPVELLNFDAHSLKSSIKLNWTTASEKNNKGFELQRTITPPDNFEKMAWLNGNGTSTSIHYYNFEDKNVKEGITYYYRLKQEDYNGNYEFSKVVAANIGKGDFTFSVIPNPYSGSTNITYNLTGDSKVSIEVVNVMGQKVATLVDGMQEEGNYRFDFSAKNYGYAAGIYTVRILVNDQVYSKRILEKD